MERVQQASGNSGRGGIFARPPPRVGRIPEKPGFALVLR
jgi:hypothetical protein